MSTRSLSRLAAAFAIAAVFGSAVASGQSIVRTWTSNADFDQGTLLNVNHDSPNGDQLQLNQATTPLPFVYVACSARGTAVRIDVNTGAILGEYLTAPAGMARNPSRTTVDKFGNCWVANRDESGFSAGVPKGSVIRIGVVIGGTRVDVNGTPDPAGQYLAPPFIYNTCIDRNSDGLIKTSRGLADILPWTNAAGADTHGGVTTAEDEAITIYSRVSGTNTRTVAVDANNDLWVGGLGNQSHEKLSGVTGAPIPGTQFNVGCGGYGGLIDGSGVLWSARTNGNNLLRYDTATTTSNCFYYPDNYGLGIDPATAHIWSTSLSGNVIRELAPDGTLLNTYAHGDYYAQGVAVDSLGNVWVAHSLYRNTVGHLRTDGTFIGNVALPGGDGPTGVAVDSNGKVWVTNYNTSNAMRIDPTAGPIGTGGYPVGAVDLVVDLGAGAAPYNYSDMTGFVAIGSTSPQGTFTVVQDGGRPAVSWTKAWWTSNEPLGTGVTVEVRAADTLLGLPLQPFVAVTNNVAFAAVQGRFAEVRATLFRSVAQNTSPILYDLTLQGGSPEFFLLGGFQAMAQLVTTNDILLVNPIAILPMDGSGATIVPVPNDPSWHGMRAYFQVWMYDPVLMPLDPFKASNGVDLEFDGSWKPFGPASGIQFWLDHRAYVGAEIHVKYTVY